MDMKQQFVCCVAVSHSTPLLYHRHIDAGIKDATVSVSDNPHKMQSRGSYV